MSPIILGLECSSWRASVALNTPNGVIEDAVTDDSEKNSDVLLPMAHRLMAAEGLQWSDISAIAFDAGPGAFTGIRVACGVGQGVAFGLQCPVIAVSSLECLAEGLRRTVALPEDATVLAALDARMGELYVATLKYEKDDWGWYMSPALMTPEALMNTSLKVDVAVGDGFLAHSIPGFAERWVEAAPQVPTASALVHIACTRFSRGLTSAPQDVELLYVRNKVALTSKEREARHG